MRRVLAFGMVSAVLVGAAFGCGGGKQEAETGAGVGAEDSLSAAARSAASGLGELESPVTFVGVVPCADCPGIQVTLTLRPDGLFFRRDTYLDAGGGSAVSVVDRGTWVLEGKGAGLALSGEGNAPHRYGIPDASTLRMLDAEGGGIESALSYDLKRIPRPDPFEDAFRLEGMYSYMADAGLFADCSTGRRWPVAMESANAELERAYLQARHEPGEPVLIRVEGRFVQRPKMDGPGEEEMLVVDEVLEVDSAGSCPEAP